MENAINPNDYKILIVDDMVANLSLLKVVLKKQGFGVVTAVGGQAALDAVASEKPDLLLLDVMMPDIDGFEVARRLRREPASKETPIIFLTALTTTEDMLRGAEAGGNDYVSKPFKREVLLARIDYQLRMLNASRALIRRTEELNLALQERDRLHALISHDLRSPLGNVKMILNLLLDSLDKDAIGEDMHELLLMANRTAEDTFSLLENLLSWSKNQMGRLALAITDINLSATIQGTLEVFTSISQTKNISILMEEMPDVTVRADVDLLKTILRNLLSNAVKFSNDGGEIVVSAEQHGEEIFVHVRDHGKGIKKDDQEKILNPNYSFTTYGTKNEEGSGLGLSLCMDFTKKLGGRLWFESKEGEGSTFSFSLPLAQKSDSVFSN